MLQVQVQQQDRVGSLQDMVCMHSYARSAKLMAATDITFKSNVFGSIEQGSAA
jgi:hypothetical protein